MFWGHLATINQISGAWFVSVIRDCAQKLSVRNGSPKLPELDELTECPDEWWEEDLLTIRENPLEQLLPDVNDICRQEGISNPVGPSPSSSSFS